MNKVLNDVAGDYLQYQMVRVHRVIITSKRPPLCVQGSLRTAVSGITGMKACICMAPACLLDSSALPGPIITGRDKSSTRSYVAISSEMLESRGDNT